MLPPQFLGDPDSAVWLDFKSGFAFNMLIIVRVIGGIGVGITSVVAPVYISELTLPENRGKIVSIYQLSITLGILLAFLMDWIVLNQAGDAAGIITENGSSGFLNWLFVEEIWRGMFGTEIPIALLFSDFALLYSGKSTMVGYKGKDTRGHENDDQNRWKRAGRSTNGRDQ